MKTENYLGIGILGFVGYLIWKGNKGINAVSDTFSGFGGGLQDIGSGIVDAFTGASQEELLRIQDNQNQGITTVFVPTGESMLPYKMSDIEQWKGTSGVQAVLQTIDNAGGVKEGDTGVVSVSKVPIRKDGLTSAKESTSSNPVVATPTSSSSTSVWRQSDVDAYRDKYGSDPT